MFSRAGSSERRECGDVLVVDEEGLELLDVRAVQEEAARALAGFALDAARCSAGTDSHPLVIEVRDDAGPVMNVRFAFEIALEHSGAVKKAVKRAGTSGRKVERRPSRYRWEDAGQ